MKRFLFSLLVMSHAIRVFAASPWISWTKDQGVPGLIHAMAKEKNVVWLGTDSGLVKFDVKKNKGEYIEGVRQPVFSMALHRQTLWLGTKKGVIQFQTDKHKVLPMTEQDGWP